MPISKCTIVYTQGSSESASYFCTRRRRDIAIQYITIFPVGQQQQQDRNQVATLSNKPKGIPIVKIRRRKFSWKNYPELEEFLVANREEYLRHSALNYTLQQKQYNKQPLDGTTLGSLHTPWIRL